MKRVRVDSKNSNISYTYTKKVKYDEKKTEVPKLNANISYKYQEEENVERKIGFPKQNSKYFKIEEVGDSDDKDCAEAFDNNLSLKFEISDINQPLKPYLTILKCEDGTLKGDVLIQSVQETIVTMR